MCPPQVAAVPVGALVILSATAGGSAALAAFLLAHLLMLIGIVAVCSGYLTTITVWMARHYRRHPAWARIAAAKAKALEQAPARIALPVATVRSIESARLGPVYGMSQLDDGSWALDRAAAAQARKA